MDERIPPVGAGVRWRITCFITLLERRRRGVATAALRAALESIRAQGGGLVEAYPTLTPHDVNRAHTGTVALFEREGFSLVDRPNDQYVVMQLEL